MSPNWPVETMTALTPRQPPRFVPTLTERVQSAAPAPVELPPQPTLEAPPSAVTASEGIAHTSENLETVIDAWLDRWLAEHAPVLLEQLLDRIADDLRHSLKQQLLPSLSADTAPPRNS